MDICWLGDFLQGLGPASRQLLVGGPAGVGLALTYGALLLAVPVYWLLPGRTLREWLLILASFAYAALVMDRLGAGFVVVLALIVYVLIASHLIATRTGAVAVTLLLVASYSLIQAGALRTLALQHLPPDTSRLLFSLRPPSGLLGMSSLTWLSYLMPIRIVHVIWDVHLQRTKLAGVRSFLSYCLFFPCLPCAPFLTWQEYDRQLDSPTRPTLRTGAYALLRLVSAPVRLFTAAMMALLLMATRNSALSMPLGYSPGELWLAVYAFTINFYLILTANADFAVGYGLLLGVRVPENFARPLTATNIALFWRKWNAVMNGWFQTYIYFPLGGSRKGELRTHLNYFAVMLACGAWHGWNWPFLIWGAAHGAALSITRLWQRHVSLKLEGAVARVAGVLSAFLTFSFASAAFAVFRHGMTHSPMQTVIEMLMRMFALG